MPQQIQLRRGTAILAASINPILAEGEPAVELDTGKFKVGNGTSHWNDLPYSSGVQGPQGPQGSVGPQGSQGSQGNVGVQGPQGFQGNQGTQGVTGSTGSQGPQGFQGNQGSQGVVGSTGSQGPQGFQGTVGNIGSQGPQGFQGFQGNQGTTGSTGSQGPQGFQGNQGNQGVTGAGYLATSTTSFTIGTGSKVFTTQAGLAYLAGDRVRASSASGIANWMEGQVTAYAGTSLTVNVDLVGGSGTKTDWNIGIAGNPGSQGPQGFQGNQGNQGNQGFQGFQGVTGSTGSQGPQGFQGNGGPQGPQGDVGADGPQGAQSTWARMGSQAAISTTLADVSGLSIPLAASGVYEFYGFMGTQSSSTAGNQFGVQCSVAGATVHGWIEGSQSALGSNNLTVRNRIVAQGAQSTAMNLVAGDGIVTLGGIVVAPASACNFTIRAKKATSGTGAVYANSFLKVTRIS